VLLGDELLEAVVTSLEHILTQLNTRNNGGLSMSADAARRRRTRSDAAARATLV